MKKALFLALIALNSAFAISNSEAERRLRCVKYIDEKACNDADLVLIMKCFRRDDSKSCDALETRCLAKNDGRLCGRMGEFLVGYATGQNPNAEYHRLMGLQYLQHACKLNDSRACSVLKQIQ